MVARRLKEEYHDARRVFAAQLADPAVPMFASS
jgi:hypothetical protein